MASTPICDAVIHLCRVRVTRINALGQPIPGPNNSYVTDKPMMLTAKVNIEAGQDKTLVGGCDCIIASYRGTDKLKRFDLELDLGVMEPGLMEMMLGTSAIIQNGVPIGNWWTPIQSCSVPQQPSVCFEAWQDLWNVDHQESVYPYMHWIWPSSSWTIADHTLQNDFLQPKLTGYTRGNTNWGLGIYGDQPEAAQPLGGWFYTNTTPVAACGYQTHAIT